MVLGQERVGRICAIGIGPWLVLMLTAGINDTGASSFEFLGYCIDYWSDERCKQRQNEKGQSFGDLLDQRLQTRYLFDGGRYRPSNLVSEFQDGVYLSYRFGWIKVRAHAGNTRTRWTTY